MANTLEQLTTDMAAGDAAAIEAFYRAWFDRLFLLARQSLHLRRFDESTCLDIVHDAMLRIVRCVRPMQSETHLLNWCRIVIQSCALDRLRRESRRAKRERDYEPQRSEPDDLTEQIAWLDGQIAQLDPALARLIRLRFNEGWTLARIAALFNSTTSQIDGQLRRTIQKLRVDAQAAFGEG